ncbi:nuclear transport factor 2 family protein [Actinoplanes sp. Pm04-4]|uniref:Nuclear transport factor 2 family protein n=1 Tax=Paractinoplanes pyxinae TaxID=2997416 RepID=A0ABT4AT32_9ACTN|nr:nuclear transport factor 2 family protein [Actinoplanes pyxinae]MCY1136513.1 nuclear transport factor 2 family protein [Actinoplanes pyxinae]
MTSIPIAQLPTVIRDYLTAHTAGDTEAALRAFAPDAVVVDEGYTFRGADEIHGFLGKAGTQYTYTTELTGAQRVDDSHWVATNHLEGNFPGGVVDLNYRFTLAGDLITELVIAP